MMAADGFTILMPDDVTVLGARFVCSILMHLQVEGKTRRGLMMQKYAANHHTEFVNPTVAWACGVMQ